MTTSGEKRPAPRRSGRRFGRRVGGALAVLALAGGLSACGSDDDDSAGGAGSTTIAPAAAVTTTTVAASTQIVTLDFSFDGLTVAANQPLTIVNRGAAPHTVTAEDGSFDVQVNAGATASLAALPPGTYPIRCRFHATSQNMVGTLTVR